ncbi:MAG: GDP-L-fucose synthase [Armatimonadetes bacterium]|nr:GDP-L-fucose synthase [Armatimonadota bacterium]
MLGVRDALAGKRVVVTGGSGFLGSHVREAAERLGIAETRFLGSRDYDLTRPDGCARMLEKEAPDVLIHLAAVCGGIGANRAEPGRFFYANAVMGIHLIEEARKAGVGKFVQVGTVCSYPKLASPPFREDDLWDGYPEETNAPYGLAKKMLLVQLQAYREQYGFNGIYLIPVNLYGPRDNFNLRTSHVIPALIRKFDAARRKGERRVVCWGDGSPSREFLYVRDAAEGVLRGAALYDGGQPVNLGTGDEIVIKALSELIAEMVGFDGVIEWDTSKPNGQPRRQLDTRRARELFGWAARTPLREGLKMTIEWYRENAAVPGPA